MIIDLIDKTQKQLDAYTQAQVRKNQQEDIENIYREITNLSVQLSILIEGYQVSIHFAPPDIVSSIEQKIKTIKSSLIQSKTDCFNNHDFKQVINLENIKSNIVNTTNDIHRLWLSHVQELVSPYRSLANIANTLPKMQGISNTINRYIENLDQISNKPPNITLWYTFTEILQQLATELNELEGLDKEKKEFINNIRQKQALVSDLTPELLEWCNHQGIATVLTVRFKDHG